MRTENGPTELEQQRAISSIQGFIRELDNAKNAVTQETVNELINKVLGLVWHFRTIQLADNPNTIRPDDVFNENTQTVKTFLAEAIFEVWGDYRADAEKRNDKKPVMQIGDIQRIIDITVKKLKENNNS